MRFAVIVQARLGSSRLPGKVLAPLGARTALARCLSRCAAIPSVDVVVAAIPETPDNDPLALEAAACGAMVFRGDERDVLARYASAARAVNADVVMRVTSDCPFIDPLLCGHVRDLLDETGADYACNNAPPRFPHGLDCDVFPASHLHRAHETATAPYDREHVTPWLRRTPGLHRAALVGPGGALARMRWTLDHGEDLRFFQAMFDAFGEAAASASWEDIAAWCVARPELPALNASCTDEARLQATPPEMDVWASLGASGLRIQQSAASAAAATTFGESAA